MSRALDFDDYFKGVRPKIQQIWDEADDYDRREQVQWKRVRENKCPKCGKKKENCECEGEDSDNA
jgi:excinuclease UvrABC ATPase subunit